MQSRIIVVEREVDGGETGDQKGTNGVLVEWISAPSRRAGGLGRACKGFMCPGVDGGGSRHKKGRMLRGTSSKRKVNGKVQR